MNCEQVEFEYVVQLCLFGYLINGFETLNKEKF